MTDKEERQQEGRDALLLSIAAGLEHILMLTATMPQLVSRDPRTCLECASLSGRLKANREFLETQLKRD